MNTKLVYHKAVPNSVDRCDVVLHGDPPDGDIEQFEGLLRFHSLIGDFFIPADVNLPYQAKTLDMFVHPPWYEIVDVSLTEDPHTDERSPIDLIQQFREAHSTKWRLR